MSDLEDSHDEDSPNKKGKKKYYPFGTPTHNSVAYSKFAHLNNAQTQDFAAQLASSSSVLEVREPVPEKPKRVAKKTASKAPVSGAAPVEDPAAAIPDTEGLEPCTKIACQLVLRSIADIQFRNEVERDEIEDEYERLLQDLAAAEQEVVAAEGKLLTLNDIGSQLEMRSNQLHEKVESLQNTKDAQDAERNDINSKLMILQTDKNKRLRQLDKANKALSDAMWRKKKKEQQDNADAGLSLASSAISEKPIKHTDASTVASLGSIYKTSYNKLAAEKVRDVIELPPTVKTLPPYMVEMMAQPAEVKAMDKYAQKHYKKAMESNVKSWEGMDGSLITASIYSASSKGFGPEIVAESFEEYNKIKSSRAMSSGISTAASSRVGSILQSRSNLHTPQGGSAVSVASHGAGGSVGYDPARSLELLSHLVLGPEKTSPTGSRFKGKYSSSSVSGGGSHKHKRTMGKSGSNNQIRLAPLDASASGLAAQGAASAALLSGNVFAAHVGESGLESADGSAYGYGSGEVDGVLGDGALSVSQFSALSADSHLLQGSLSPQSLSMSLSASDFNPFGENGSVSTAARRKLDPAFFKDQPRYEFGRRHPVGKLRKAEITWGMKSYVDPSKVSVETDEDEDVDANASNRGKNAPPRRAGNLLSSGASQKSLSRASTASSSRTFRDPNAAPPAEPTVKSRSLTVYHPNMQIFQDAAKLPKKQTV